MLPGSRLRVRVQVAGDVAGGQAGGAQQRDRELGHVLADALALVPGLLGVGAHAGRAGHVGDVLVDAGGDGLGGRVR